MHGTEELEGKERSETRHLDTRWVNLFSMVATLWVPPLICHLVNSQKQ